ncbi:AAA family ATPase [Niveispirillum sp. KHB5.9]|uniref:AAA family ATPase n=1 Tax=Niveispirillum sp. KHB5.9 TaxID=3400269 RepID=UPI003A8AC9BC
MKILELADLDTSHVKAAYQKVVAAIERQDFRAAQVKKLTGTAHRKLYRAKLNDADRLIFTLVRRDGDICAVMLEIVHNHAYDRSRFLRGIPVDDEKSLDCEAGEAAKDAEPLRYLNPAHSILHFLDKPISFDDMQDAVFRAPAPMIIVGSAGSGKTALILEKLKQADGEVLYVTQSAFLAQNARNLYYANGFVRDKQDATFLSLREFIESIHVPTGREATWRDFAGWAQRSRPLFQDIDSHQAFEEIRGVVTAHDRGTLSREDYLALGVRQSIFQAEMRDRLYTLFEKYRAWLADARLFDLNLVAQDWIAKAAPRYDFIVIDEVQDITPVQLLLVLKTLKTAGQFLLCGDSNQIVHPNFFSWSHVKSLFWHDPALAERQQLSVLAANFRNSQAATRVANQLLKIKQRRFGSIDRESNFLVRPVGAEDGVVTLAADKEPLKRDLNQKIRQSTRFAVLVMRDEDKAEARKHFNTPLLFSIHEAKGLEYENIVLYRFISDYRAEFNEIADGVSPDDLTADELAYRRARDKTDKSLEVYKFFVNALYVALTRATANLYLIESDTTHPLLRLLDLRSVDQMQVEARQSSLEEWQREARKLELQGKQEQVNEIRRTILREVPVPWPVFDEQKTTELLVKVFKDKAPGSKPRQQLVDIAMGQDLPLLAERVHNSSTPAARSFAQQRAQHGMKSYAAFAAKNFKDILRQCDSHGIEHRLPMNQTPLMAAAACGNLALVEALIDRGASLTATDHFGYNASQWAMQEAFREERFAKGPFAALYDLLAPASIDINTGDRLVRIDRHLVEYSLFQTFWVLFRSRFTYPQRHIHGALATQEILDAWEHLPANAVPTERKRRQYLSGVLARNEVSRDYPYNRALFKRRAQGWYQFNPALSVRWQRNGEETWVPIFQALNLPFIAEFTPAAYWGSARDALEDYLQEAAMPPATAAIMG